MINPEDETVIDSRRSITIDECVAKMLGWMQGTIRLASPKRDQWGVLPEELPHLSRLEYPLEFHLYHLRERARNELFDAVESGQHDEVIWEKDDAVKHWTDISEKASSYMSSLIKEIEKGESSALVLDKYKTDQVGDIHVTLESLEIWAAQFFNTLNPCTTEQSDKSVKQKGQRRHDALSAELEEILNQIERPTAGKVMAILRLRTGKNNTCIIDNVGSALKWEDGFGNVKLLDSKGLFGRIGTWKKHKDNPG